MNRIELPRAAFHFQALLAAAIVTVAMLSGIDALAGHEGPALMAAATAPAARG